MSDSRENTTGRGETGRKLAHTSKANSASKKPKKKVPKSHSDYWRSRIRKSVRNQNGGRYESPNYSARMSWNGRRQAFPLTTNKESSACKAAEIYRYLQRNGWDRAIEKYAPHLIETPEEEPQQIKTRIVTLGEYLREAEAVSTVNVRTFRDYCQSIRRITAEVLNLKPPGRGVVGRKVDRSGKVLEKGKQRCLSPHDFRSVARLEFVAKVDSQPLSLLTPHLLNRWKVSRVKQVGENPIKRRQAMRSVSSMIRQGKSLFSPSMLAKIGFSEELVLPDPLPFDGVVPYSRKETGRCRYISTFDAGKLLRLASKELAESEPEAWKILLLGLGAGLRRNEIDKLLWSQVDFTRRAIQIVETPYFKPKTEDSAGEVEIDESLVALLRGYHARAHSEFVIESDRKLRKESLTGRAYSFTRAEEHFKTLYGWLREHGVDANKPLHTLRKEAGSIVCQQRDIYAASRFLRHADIQVTAEYYVDKKERITVGVGALLSPIEMEKGREQQAS